MAQIGFFSVISPMESTNYRKRNLLSPPHRSYFALHSHSNTINPRSSTPSATVISQARTQPSFGRPRFYEKNPRSGNLRISQDVPTIFKINKALSNIMKSGKYSTVLSHFNELQQLKNIELDLYTFGIAINCYTCMNQVGFGFSLLGSIFKRSYTPNVVIFYTLLKGLIAQDKTAEALSLFNKMQLLGIQPTVWTFTVAINCYCCLNRVGFGLSLLGSIFKRGYTPNVVTFTPLLNGLVAQDKVVEALSLFNMLLLQDIELNLYTFSIAINCYSCVNRVGFGFSLLGSIFKCGYTPNVVIFSTLLKGLVTQDKADEVLSHFNKLQLQDIELDLYTFNIAINCYCHVNRVGFGFSLLGNIFKLGYTPSVVTFNTLLDGLIGQDKTAEALSFFNKMQLLGIQPTVWTYTVAIKCYCCLNRVGFGLSFLGSIFKRGYTPNVVTFTPLLNGLIAQDKVVEALSLFNKLLLQDIELNLYTLKIAINCYCRVNMVGFGLSLLGGIFKRGYTPDVVAFTTLLNGLLAREKADEALFLFNKLLLQDIEPTLSTFSIAINCYCHVNRVGFGFSLLGSIFKRGYTPSVVIFSTLLKGLVTQDKADEALSHFNKLQLQDIELEMYTFCIAINCYCCMNQVGFGFSLLGCIFKLGYTPNLVTFNTLLDGLIGQDKADEAVELFEKIVKKGEFKPDVTMYGSLINRLCKMGNRGAAISFLRIAEEGGLKHDTMTYTMIIDRLSKDGLANDDLNF